MPEVQDIIDPTINSFQADIAAFRETYACVIAELESAIASSGKDLSDFFWDQIAELKGRLGAEAANTCADDDADEAIEDVDKWVADNISNADGYDVPVTLWMHGIEDGVVLIRQALAEDKAA